MVKFFMSLVLGLMLVSPAFAVMPGEDRDFTIEADIPVDPSLASHTLTFDVTGDGAAPVEKSIPASDPLGGYPFMHMHTYPVPVDLAPGDYSVEATLTSVDEAGNVSDVATASVVMTVEPLPDTTAPSAPANMQIN